MLQTQTMAELVSRHVQEVHATSAAQLQQEVLAFVEVSVTTRDGKEGVRQGSSGAIEGVSVTVLAVFKPG